MKINYFSLFMVLCVLLTSCGSDDYEPIAPDVSGVNFDLSQVPLQKLSEYNFFKGDMKAMQPEDGLLEYEPINTLFTDYASKKRWVYMPQGAAAVYIADDEVLDFPNGAVMVKNFYYENMLPQNEQRIIETRLIYKTPQGWKFAEYIWNEEQTEAVLNLSGANVPLSFTHEGTAYDVDYRIPSEAECIVCHKKQEANTPIGPKPFSLNSTLSYADGSENQLLKWQESGYLENVPAGVTKIPYWKDTTLSLDERVRGYMEINCAHCHSDLGHCSYRPVRYSFEQSADDANMGVCVTPEEPLGAGQVGIVQPGNHRRSMMYYRMNSTEAAERMPLLGRSIADQEAVDLVEQWINNMTTPCN